MNIVFTSVNNYYIPKACVLAQSVKQHHPNWHFVLLLSDRLPKEFDTLGAGFDEVLTVEELGIEHLPSWLFRHSIVELCTAVKGRAAQLLAQREGVSAVIYLDPDTKLFAPLEPIEEMLETHDVLLTPHLLSHEDQVDDIVNNEICALQHGAFNLGFFAARTSGQGTAFLDWFARRLLLFCRDDIGSGLFTDQRWCDLAPGFFDRLGIVRDEGCNVATWNIHHRPLSVDTQGSIFAGKHRLRFYHFTGFDNGTGRAMLAHYAQHQDTAHLIWREYWEALNANGQTDQRFKPWAYGVYDNGRPITPGARILYRSQQVLQERFPNPYSTSGDSYAKWYGKYRTVRWLCGGKEVNMRNPSSVVRWILNIPL